jgi:hypothetical protein
LVQSVKFAQEDAVAPDEADKSPRAAVQVSAAAPTVSPPSSADPNKPVVRPALRGIRRIPAKPTPKAETEDFPLPGSSKEEIGFEGNGKGGEGEEEDGSNSSEGSGKGGLVRPIATDLKLPKVSKLPEVFASVHALSTC